LTQAYTFSCLLQNSDVIRNGNKTVKPVMRVYISVQLITICADVKSKCAV